MKSRQLIMLSQRPLKVLIPLSISLLLPFQGIGPVLASGILAEIGTIISFDCTDSLAKYAGSLGE